MDLLVSGIIIVGLAVGVSVMLGKQLRRRADASARHPDNGEGDDPAVQDHDARDLHAWIVSWTQAQNSWNTMAR